MPRKNSPSDNRPVNTAVRVLRIIGNVLLYAFLGLCLALLVLAAFTARGGDGGSLFGYEMRLVVSSSMEQGTTDVSSYKIKSLPVKSMVFIQKVPQDKEEAQAWYDSLEVGDVLTFKYVYVRQETITHRLVKKEAKPTGGYILTLEGDNKDYDSRLLQQTIDTSDEFSMNYVIGKVVYASKAIGYAVYALKQPVGITLLIIVPGAIIIIFEIVRIFSILSNSKKEKLAAENKRRTDEIDDLKRRLAELENKPKDGEQ